jgi:hypothetical protein
VLIIITPFSQVAASLLFILFPLENVYFILLRTEENAERWPCMLTSAAARDQHLSRGEKGYLRKMLSRRQLQGFVGLRRLLKRAS